MNVYFHFFWVNTSRVLDLQVSEWLILRNCTHPLKKRKQNAVVQVPLSNIGEGALYWGKEEAHRGDAESGRQKKEKVPRRDSRLGDSWRYRQRRQCAFLMEKNQFLATYTHACINLVSSTFPFSSGSATLARLKRCPSWY